MSSDGILLVIVWSLFWIGACLRSLTYWIVVVFFAIQLDWLKAVPRAYANIDNTEHWWLFGCNALALVVIAQAGSLRDVLEKRRQSRPLRMDRDT